jgi:BlaR1 peptidase M56
VTGLSWEVTVPLLGLAWFAALNLTISIVVLFVSRWLDDRLTANPWRARRLLALRLAPAFLSLAVVGVLFMPAHLWLEPAKADERIGFVPIMLAVSGLFLLVRAVYRAAHAIRRTVRLATLTPRRELRRGGLRLLEVPGLCGVALAGIFRPRILIGTRARRVLTAAELDLAVAHEHAHRQAGDNLSRALMHCAPDFLGFFTQARRLERVWEAEAECVADAAAVNGNPVRATRLASALVKVARLASAESTWSPGWSTFHQPALLEVRVRMLVSSPQVPSATAGCVRAAATCGLAVVAAAWMGGIPQQLHWLTEAVIALLP